MKKVSSNTVEISEALNPWVLQYKVLNGQAGSENGGQIGWLSELRNKAIATFESEGFPSTRHEEWKYTSVRNLLNREYAFPMKDGGEVGYIVTSDLQDWLQGDSGVECHRIVVVNGRFDAAQSRILDDVIEVKSLSEAFHSDSEALKGRYGTVANISDSPFVALNTALARDGVFLSIPKGKTAKYPVHIAYFTDATSAHRNPQVRVFMHAGENSECHVVEQWYHDGEHHGFVNHVAEIVVEKAARFHLNSIQTEAGAHSLINFTQVEQAENSHFHSVMVSTAGELIRNNVHARHTGEYCETHLGGLYMLDEKQHVDNHTLVDHAVPNCYSNELYKGVLDGNSTAVFNGKVMVRKHAQKTNAFQSNKTILLSKGATINTKPQLEIFADDVKCSHGATTGQLDETALFYMRSRGIGEQRARALLTYAFAAEVLGKVKIEGLRDWLDGQIRSRLFHTSSETTQ
ncbi:MAG: Fe-S cluster assembly protein SufD [Bacteroidota bacterium]